MKSVKPGRGPSAMGAAGGLIGAAFGVLWTIGALNMGAPPVLAGFGVLFIVAALVQAFYNFTNATGENRMSIVDIAEGYEEVDPLQAKFAHNGDGPEPKDTEIGEDINFCPHCGRKIDGDFQFCPKCGRQL